MPHILNSSGSFGKLLATLALFAAGGLATWPAAVNAADKTEKTKEIKAGDIRLTVPESWEQKQNSSQMRVAELRIPAVGDDKESAELAVLYFGPNGAGSVQDNIKRWIDQVDADGRKHKVVTGESKQGKYTLVDVAGTYNKSIGPPIQRKTKALPGWRVVNVFLETDKGPYFLKLDGPEKTVASVETALREAFGAKRDAEKEVPAK